MLFTTAPILDAPWLTPAPDPVLSGGYWACNAHMEAGRAYLASFTHPGGEMQLPFLLRPLPRQWGVAGYDVTWPYGYGGPIFSVPEVGPWPQIYRAFLPHWDDFCRQNHVVAELMRWHPHLNAHLAGVFDDNTPDAQVLPVTHTVWVNLRQPPEVLWQQLAHSKRQKVDLARRRGLLWQDAWAGNAAQQYDQLAAFWQVYQAAMARKEARPFYRFGDALKATMADGIARKTVWLGTGWLQDTCLGGLLVLVGSHTSHYFLSAVAPEGRKLHIATVGLWEAIQCMQQQGGHWLYLGGGLQMLDSLEAFKRDFSPLTWPFCIGTRVHCHEKYEALRQAMAQEQPSGWTPPPHRLMFYRQ
jgi:hypothetical protein